MMLYIFCYFVAGRLLFSILGRWDMRFILVEALSSVGFVGVALLCALIPIPILAACLIGLLYLLLSLASRFFLPENPIETAFSQDTQKSAIISVGIIDFSWLFIMAGALAIIVFLNSIPPLSQSIETGQSTPYYAKTHDFVTMLLGKILDAFFFLGATLGACMAILWSGEIWRKKAAESQKEYREATIASMKMVVAFMVVGLGAFIWVGAPLYVLANTLLEKMR